MLVHNCDMYCVPGAALLHSCRIAHPWNTRGKEHTHNWDLLVFGPELAMLSTPRPVWERLGLNSSLNGFPQNDSPPGAEEERQREPG